MIGIIISAAILGLLAYLQLTKRPKIVAPGPPGIPLLGNLLQMDRRKPHLTLSNWARQYGTAYVVRMGSENWLILNSYETISNALIRNGDVFGGRPKVFRFWFASRGYSDILVADSLSEKWRFLRKTTHRSIKLHGDGMKRLEDAVKEFTDELMTTFDNYKGAAFDPRVSFYNFVIKSIYYLSMGDKLEEKFGTVRQFERDYIEPNSMGKGAELDTFSWLRYFGNSTYKQLKRAVDASDDFWAANYPAIFKKYDSSDPRCVVDSLIQMVEQYKEMNKRQIFDEVHIKMVFLDLIVAGVVTTTTSLVCLINILLHHPQVAKKLQEEVDRVVGSSRPTTLPDRADMPYTRATIFELLRYTSVMPASIPHATQSDTEVDGINIPAGTNVIPNLWHLHHDEEFWGDPWAFRPERFLDADGQLLSADHDNRMHLMPFGAGTRVCVGEVFALSRIFLAVTSLLQRFNFVPDEEKNLVPCDPRTYEMGIILSPQSFKIKAILRT